MKNKTEPVRLEHLLALGAIGILILSVVVRLYLTSMRSIPTAAANATSAMAYGNAQAVPTLDVTQAIVAVLAAVFAIAFGFSQFVVPNISEKYSPRMLVFFKRDHRYRRAYLSVFLTMFFSVSSLLFSESLDQSWRFPMAILLVVPFMISLVLFSIYYAYIFEVANPIQFCSTVEDQILSSLREKDTDEVQNGAAALADSAVKAINREGEQQNVRKFLDSLGKVAIELIQQSQDESIWSSIESVFVDVSRVYQAAEKKKDADITNYTFLKIRQMGVSLLASK